MAGQDGMVSRHPCSDTFESSGKQFLDKQITVMRFHHSFSGKIIVDTPFSSVNRPSTVLALLVATLIERATYTQGKITFESTHILAAVIDIFI